MLFLCRRRKPVMGMGLAGGGTSCWVWLREWQGAPFGWKVLLQVRLSAK
jgi:hypothetical protein